MEGTSSDDGTPKDRRRRARFDVTQDAREELVDRFKAALESGDGGKEPRRIPAWLGRLVIGRHGVAMMTESRGSSNAKAKRLLGWKPAWPSWREGFRGGL